MAQNHYRKIQIHTDDLEWLYIPDVEYKRWGEVSRCLQMIVPYRPEWKGEERFPLIVYLPGSAFYRQDMYCGVPQFAKIAERGYVVAALQYRESEIAKFPAQIQDVHNAISFLKDNAARFHIDPDRIFLWGHSSGAYNSLMAGVTAGIEEFDGGANHQIRGVIAASAPSYLSYEVQVLDTGAASYQPEDYRPELDMLGLKTFEEDMELFRRSRVASYVNRQIPAILLLHGDQDRDVTVENSRKLYRELTQAGKYALFYELQGQGHGGAMLWDNRFLNLADDFIRELL